MLFSIRHRPVRTVTGGDDDGFDLDGTDAWVEGNIFPHLHKYGGTPDGIDPGSAEAYAVGQLVQEVANKTKKLDNKTIISSLHQGTWPVIEGNLSWNADGSPKGSTLLVEWVNGKLVPVYPAATALHAPTEPKPAWTG